MTTYADLTEPNFTEPKASRQKVTGYGYMTVWGIFDAVETRLEDGRQLSKPTQYGWIRGQRCNGGYQLVAMSTTGERWHPVVTDHSTVVGLAIDEPAEATLEEEALQEAETESIANDEGLVLRELEPRYFEAREDGKLLGEICQIEGSGRWQPMSPWSHHTYEDKDEAINEIRRSA